VAAQRYSVDVENIREQIYEGHEEKNEVPTITSALQVFALVPMSKEWMDISENYQCGNAVGSAGVDARVSATMCPLPIEMGAENEKAPVVKPLHALRQILQRGILLSQL